MKTRLITQSAALLLAAAAMGGAFAQTAPNPAPTVMSDMNPLPAEDRGSFGAIVLEERPVLAKQALSQQTVARNREMMSTVMGAGAAVPAAQDEQRVIDIQRGKVYVVPAKK